MDIIVLYFLQWGVFGINGGKMLLLLMQNVVEKAPDKSVKIIFNQQSHHKHEEPTARVSRTFQKRCYSQTDFRISGLI